MDFLTKDLTTLLTAIGIILGSLLWVILVKTGLSQKLMDLVSFGKKKNENNKEEEESGKLFDIRHITSEKKVVFIFIPNLIMECITINKLLFSQLKESRENMETLVLDFSNVVMINNDTKDALRLLISDIVKNNNIKCMIIFPTSDILDEEFKYADEKCKLCHSLIVKKG